MKINNNEPQLEDFDKVLKDAFHWRYFTLLPFLMDALKSLGASEYRILFLLHENHKEIQEVAVSLSRTLNEIEEIVSAAHKKIHNFLSEKGLGDVFEKDFIPDLLEDSAEMPELFSDSYYMLKETRYEVMELSSTAENDIYIFELIPKSEQPEIYGSRILFDDQRDRFALDRLAANSGTSKPWVIIMDTGRDDFEAYMFCKNNLPCLRVVSKYDPGEVHVSLYPNDKKTPISEKLIFEDAKDGRYIAQVILAIDYRPTNYRIDIDFD